MISRRTSAWAAVIGLVCTVCSVPAQPLPSVLDRVVEFDIPAQPLASALLVFSEQAGIQVYAPSSAVRQHSAERLQGKMSLRDALDRLLADAPIVYRVLGDNKIGFAVDAARSAGSSADLDDLLTYPDTIDVSGSSRRNTETRTQPDNDVSGGSFPAPSRRVIDEIVVTATKREKSLREIPASIAALTGEALEESGAEGMAEYMSKMPGVTMNQAFGGANSNRVTVRGIGMSTATNDASNPTGIFIEETPFSDPFLSAVSPDVHPFDLKSIEVLKGPQGTLFGGSALAGLVRYTLQPANLESWETRYLLSYVDMKDGGVGHTAAAALNAPVTDTLALRVVALDRETPGTIDNLRTGEKDIERVDQRAARLLASWEPTDRLSISAISMVQDSFQHDFSFVGDPADGRQRDNTLEPSTSDSRITLHNVRVNYTLRFADLIASTSVVEKVLDSVFAFTRIANNEAPPEPSDRESLLFPLNSKSYGVMQEVRLVSPGSGRWEWIAGLFAQDYTLQNHITAFARAPTDPSDILLPGGLLPGVPAIVSDIDARVKEIALFGDVTWTVRNDFDLNLGLRLYDIDIIGDVDYESAGTRRDLDADISERGVSPRLAATWQLRGNFQIYAQTARGFRYGGVQLAAPVPVVDDGVPEVYGSDTLWNYELGLRTDWLDRSLQADLAIFYIDWEDAQFSQVAPSATFNYIDNIAAARSRGIEGALLYLPPIDGLTLSLAASYVDAVTTEPFQDANGNDIPTGTRLPGSSAFHTAASVAWSRSIGPWQFDANLTHAYLGEGFSNITHDHRILDYELIDVQFGLSRPDRDMWPDVRLVVQNVLDEYGVVNVYTAAGIADHFLNRPRTIRLQISGQF